MVHFSPLLVSFRCIFRNLLHFYQNVPPPPLVPYSGKGKNPVAAGVDGFSAVFMTESS